MYIEDLVMGLFCGGVFLIPLMVLAVLASSRAKRALREQRQLTDKIGVLERRVEGLIRGQSLRAKSAGPAVAPGSRPQSDPTSEPVLSEPVLSEPVLSEPVLSEPVLSEPVLSEPVPSAPEPSEPVRPAVAFMGAAGKPQPPARARPVVPAAIATPTAPQPIVQAAPSSPSASVRRVTPVSRWHEQFRAQFAGAEWEAVLGGNWLNKVGVLVLVIGLALFLGYSLAHFGAIGRLLIGYSISVGMIVSGARLLRRPGYRIFASGLLGGGWAAVYFTVYAMYGLQAARIIESPLLGILLLAIAAAMMIAHALHYRSEAATAMALLFGFITIVISPVSLFASLASVPLVVAVVMIAHRFSWLRIAIGGSIVTYATYAFRFGPLVFQSSWAGELIAGQSLLFAYWLLYEGFDIISVGNRRVGLTAAATLFPLNACGFLGVSLLQWSNVSPQTISIFFAFAATMFLVSSLLRAWWRSPSGFDDSVGLVERAASGGYEAAVTMSAALAVFAILQQFAGPQVTIALLVEGGLLFFAGLRLQQTCLRALASAVYAFLVLRFFAIDLPGGHEVTVAGFSLMSWTPAALLTIASFYVNRAMTMRQRADGWLIVEAGYSYAAAVLLTKVVGIEFPTEFVGLLWLVIAVVLLEVGMRANCEEFRVQAALVGSLACGCLMTVNGLLVAKQSWVAATMLPVWIWLLPATVLLYAVAVRLYGRESERPENELRGWRNASLTMAAILLTIVIWHALPSPVVVLGWAVLSLLLVELGFRWQIPSLRIQGHVIAALTFGRLFLANFTNPGVTGTISHRLLTVTPIIVFFYYLRSKVNWEQLRERVFDWEHRLRRLYLYAPFVLIVLLMRFELGRVSAVLGWSILCVVLFALGRRSNNQDLRWQSYLLAILTFVRCWTSNFNIPESLSGAFGRVGTGVAVIACFYLAQYLAPHVTTLSLPRSGHPTASDENGVRRWLIFFDQNARNLFSVLATLLLSVLVYYEVSGRMLTMAWGLEGTILLVVGFAARERVLRLAGLALLALCTIKVFIVDLRTLETPFRIMSFVMLGILLIAVSWFYTTYRKQIQQRV